MLEPGKVIRGRYRITGPLARGGMGELFFADDLSTGRPVVVKTLLSSLLDRVDLKALFYEEAMLTMRLQHPRIVKVFDYGSYEDTCFYVMELLEGATLGALMRRAYDERKGLPIPVVLAVGIQLCEALDHGAHMEDQNHVPMALVHRDLSPLNVFITDDGCTKLLDFGIARVSNASRHRLSPSLRGKPSYRSPEMVRGEQVDARSDLFTLGIILWEAIAGRKLFCSQPQDESERRILSMKIPPISMANPDVPPGMDRLIAKSLERNPRDRFQTADQMRVALKRLYRLTTDERQQHVLSRAVAQSKEPLPPPV